MWPQFLKNLFSKSKNHPEVTEVNMIATIGRLCPKCEKDGGMFKYDDYWMCEECCSKISFDEYDRLVDVHIDKLKREIIDRVEFDLLANPVSFDLENNIIYGRDLMLATSIHTQPHDTDKLLHQYFQAINKEFPTNQDDLINIRGWFERMIDDMKYGGSTTITLIRKYCKSIEPFCKRHPDLVGHYYFKSIIEYYKALDPEFPNKH